MQINSPEYWEARYQNADAPWDAGDCTPPFKAYFLREKPPLDSAILIPGAGNAHEAFWLSKMGYSKVVVVEWSPSVAKALKSRMEDSGCAFEIRMMDFFKLHGQFDFILEQTFFCALPPDIRMQYFPKVAELLKPGGKLVGVFFKELGPGGPPFHCSQSDLEMSFQAHFSSWQLSDCPNSLAPRLGNEWWVEAG